MMKIVQERESTVDLPEADISLENINSNNSNQRSKYGNLIVLFASKNCLLTIGPHYYFFIPTLLFMVGGGLFLVSFVNHIFSNLFFQIFNACFSMLQSVAYLFVALSNPGIVFADQENVDSSNNGRQLIVCDKCGASHRCRRVRHCNYCNVCVKGYDHHCPWVSKCIGSGNYSYFSFFVGITPLYIMYYVIVLLLCLNTSLATPKPTP